HHPLDPGGGQALHEPGGQAHVVGQQQVRAAHTVEHDVPGARVVIVEPRVGVTTGRAHGDPLLPPLPDDPAAGGAGASEGEDRVGVVDARHGVVPLVSSSA